MYNFKIDSNFCLAMFYMYPCYIIVNLCVLLHSQNNLDELFMLMHFLDAGKVSVISGLLSNDIYLLLN